jgi:5-methylcytosine-specific restriction enzyme subunit McrC
MSRTISVFEYGTLRLGGQGGAGLGQAEFDALVRFNDAHQQKYFTVGHRSISFRQFVGYLQVGTLGIEVLPKADKKAAADAIEWRSMLHEMLKVGLGIDLSSAESARQALTQPSLIELVVANLTPKVERIIREGLARGYREEETNGTTFRGKLVFAEHIRKNHTRRDRSFVRHSIYDRDAVPNQLLRAGLEIAARAPVSGPLRARVAASLLSFEEVRRIAPRKAAFDRLRVTRTTERYREALLLSRMLIENLSPALRAGKVSVFAFLFDMNLLWERYIGVLFRRACSGRLRAVLQKPSTFLVHDDRRARTIRPDIALVDAVSEKTVAVLDTKWILADPRGPDDDHIKQMFVYNEMFNAPRAILVHPASGSRRASLVGTFWQRQHCCEVLELGIEHLGSTRSAATAAQIRMLLERLATAATISRPHGT